MSGAGDLMQAAAIAALDGVAELGAAYRGPPVQAVHPYAIVEAGQETDWGHKSGPGREVRLSVTLYDLGERPARLQRMLGAAEEALAGVEAGAEGWRIVTLQLLRSRIVPPRNAGGTWIGLLDYRVRMLAG
jgi:hypothetical protein